jgi:citronellol/citronellal dehydrogenase
MMTTTGDAVRRQSSSGARGLEGQRTSSPCPISGAALGLAGELRAKGIAVNALWPRTTIATAAIKNLLGGDEIMRRSRHPDIMADAACRIFAKPASFSGHFLIDDSFLAAEGVVDFERYRVDPAAPLASDFLVPDNSPPPPGVRIE